MNTDTLASDPRRTRHPALADQAQGTLAVRVRRWFLVACPVLAGLFAIIGAAADPAPGLDGRELWELYAQHPERLQFKSLGFHWSYAFWIAPALLIVGYIRGRGAWLANIAGVLGFAGMTTLPGLLFLDWYDSAIGQLYGVEGNVAVAELMEGTMWGLRVFATPGIVGLALGLPLAAAAAWRAGLVPWWAPLTVVAGFMAFTMSGVMWWGCVITTVCFTAFSVALARGTSPNRA